MAARFWVAGGSGLWSSTTNWSTTSGGGSGASVPGSTDTATFDASSGAGTATVDSNVTIQALTMTGFTGTLAFGTNSISLNSAGLIFTGDTTFSVTGTPVINVTNATATATTVNVNAMTEANSISFNFTGGTYPLTIGNFSAFKNLNFVSSGTTGFGGTLLAHTSADFTIFGNITLSSNMTHASSTLGYLFAATSGTQIITSNGKTFNMAMAQTGVGGTTKLADAFDMGATRTFNFVNGNFDGNGQTITGALLLSASGGGVTSFKGLNTARPFTVTNSTTTFTGDNTVGAFGFTTGTLNLGGYILTALSFNSSNSNTRTLNFSTSTINVTNTAGGTLWTTATITNLTITGTPVVNISNSGAVATTVSPGALTEAQAISFAFTTGTYPLTFLSTATYSCKNADFTGFAGTWAGTSTGVIYGNLTLSTGMTLTASAAIMSVRGTSGTQVITSNSKTIDFPVTFNGIGGTFQLADAMTLGATRQLTLSAGTLNLNGKTLTVGASFTTATASTKNLTFNGGTLVCPTASVTAFNNASPATFTTTAGTGTGKISMTAATAKTFVGGGSTFNCTLSNDGAGALTISGANTFTTIANGVQPTSFVFPISTTQTVTNWTVSGTAGNLVTITSGTAGTAATLSSAFGIVSSNYLSLKDSTATGGAAWYAGANSTNVSGNLGWIFTAPPATGNTSSFFFMF